MRQRKERLASGADAGALEQMPIDELAMVSGPIQLVALEDGTAVQGGGAGGSAAGAKGRGGAPAGKLPLLGKRRRVIDVLAETLGADSDGGSSDAESGDAEDVLDWRAKRI